MVTQLASSAEKIKNNGWNGMKIISKEDFQSFVNALIQEDSWNVIGVKSRGNKFAFAPLDSADELRLRL